MAQEARREEEASMTHHGAAACATQPTAGALGPLPLGAPLNRLQPRQFLTCIVVGRGAVCTDSPRGWQEALQLRPRRAAASPFACRPSHVAGAGVLQVPGLGSGASLAFPPRRGTNSRVETERAEERSQRLPWLRAPAGRVSADGPPRPSAQLTGAAGERGWSREDSACPVAPAGAAPGRAGPRQAGETLCGASDV